MKFKPSYRKNAREKYAEKHPTIVYEGATLTPAQQKIADRVVNGSEKFYIINAGRQVGKSFLSVQLLLYFSINRPDSVNLYISMTYNQTLKLFNEMIRGIKDSGILKSYSKSTFEIELKNGSRIIFRSYQNPDNLRGYHVSGLAVLDEGAFCDDSFFPQVVLPMLSNFRQSKALIVSSPKGTNWFYEWYIKGTKKGRLLNKNTISFKLTYLDNPFCDKAEIEALRVSMPDAIYRQEVLAEFVSSANSAFSNYKQCISQNIHNQPKYNERYYVGIDVGRQSDYTVATVMAGVSGEIVEILRVNQMTYQQIVDEIVKLCKKWRPVAILQEVNGVGDPVFDMLQEKLQKERINTLQPWVTSNQSKNNIIQALNIAFENKEIIIPDNLDLTDELDTFEVSYSLKNHAVTYGARIGHHDDMVLSLALVNFARRTQAQTGCYGVV
jgi:phage FluMu gp28-like protein